MWEFNAIVEWLLTILAEGLTEEVIAPIAIAGVINLLRRFRLKRAKSDSDKAIDSASQSKLEEKLNAQETILLLYKIEKRKELELMTQQVLNLRQEVITWIVWSVGFCIALYNGCLHLLKPSPSNVEVGVVIVLISLLFLSISNLSTAMMMFRNTSREVQMRTDQVLDEDDEI